MAAISTPTTRSLLTFSLKKYFANEDDQFVRVAKVQNRFFLHKGVNPASNFLQVRFHPYPYTSAEERLRTAQIHCTTVSGKRIYELDGFFKGDEIDPEKDGLLAEENFPVLLYKSRSKAALRAKPGKSMEFRRTWDTMIDSSRTVFMEISKLFCTISHKLNAEVLTQPGRLCDEVSCLSAIVTNFHTSMTEQNSRLWLHRDYNPQKGMNYTLAREDGTLFPVPFENGAKGKPWLISVIVYMTSKDFDPEEGLGTHFYDDNKELKHVIKCKHLALTIFEGDVLHSIAPSKEGVKGKRVSIVFY